MRDIMGTESIGIEEMISVRGIQDTITVEAERGDVVEETEVAEAEENDLAGLVRWLRELHRLTYHLHVLCCFLILLYMVPLFEFWSFFLVVSVIANMNPRWNDLFF